MDELIDQPLITVLYRLQQSRLVDKCIRDKKLLRIEIPCDNSGTIGFSEINRANPSKPNT